MAFTNLTGFPYQYTTVGNIAPITFGDASSLLEMLETMRKWLNDTLVPDTNTAINNAVAEFQETNAAWVVEFTDFISNFTTEIITLETAAVAEMVNTPGNAVRTRVTGLIDAAIASVTTALEEYTDVAVETATEGIETRAATALENAKTDIALDIAASAATQQAAISLRKTKLDAVDVELIIDPKRVTGPVGAKLNLPTHISSNINGEATHPSVVFRPEGWGGYPYWMAVTPYQAANDAMEDPNVLASRDGITWVVPAGVTNPLDDAPGSPASYNSDTEIAFGPDDNLYVFWRNLDPNAATNQEKIYYRKSADGVTWGPKTLAYQVNQNTMRLLSPTLIFENGAWTCWFVDMVSAPDRIMRMRSTNPEATAWTVPAAISYTDASPYQAGKAPWHISITKAYGRYHALVNDNNTAGSPPNGDLVYMTSPDGILWESAVNPCIPRVKLGEHEMLYRACLIPAVRRGVFGFRVWYGGLIHSTNPQVWHVFRTFISDGPRTDRGSFVDSVPAATSASAPGYKVRPITFERPFKYAPDVVLTSTAGFLSPAANAITTTGFNYNVDNVVQAPANDVTFYWTAKEPD